MSDNVSGADNQQGSFSVIHRNNPSETTRRAPLRKKEIIAYLNGAAHDATLNKKRRVRFAQKGKEWLMILSHLLKEVGYRSWIYREGKGRTVFVLETLCGDIHIRTNPLSLSKSERIAYVRGFFDAEGGIPRNGKRFYIQLVQKDYEKIKRIKRVLEEFGIRAGKIHNPSRRVDPNYWRIFVNVDSHRKFAKTIGSYHPVKAKIFRERMKI